MPVDPGALDSSNRLRRPPARSDALPSSAPMTLAEGPRGPGRAVMAKQAAVRRAIRAVANLEDSLVSDRDLLRRYVQEGDQEAFAAVVRRHTGLVFGVCWRALANPQDAEDACQATFLLL